MDGRGGFTVLQTRSSAHAPYIALNHTARRLYWLSGGVFGTMQYDGRSQRVIFNLPDNLKSIALFNTSTLYSYDVTTNQLFVGGTQSLVFRKFTVLSTCDYFTDFRVISEQLQPIDGQLLVSLIYVSEFVSFH
jgi:hypothetical protein